MLWKLRDHEDLVVSSAGFFIENMSYR